MMGIFPNGTGPRVRIDLSPPFHLTGAASTISSLGGNALPNGAQAVPVFMVEERNDYLLKSYSTCPELDEAGDDAEGDKLWEEKEDYYNKEIFPAVAAALNEECTTLKHGKSIVSAIVCDVAAGYENALANAGEFDGKSVWDHMVDVQTFYKFYQVGYPWESEKFLDIACTEIFNDIRDNIEQAREGGDLKFVSYAGHEKTLCILLSCLGAAEGQPTPVFASNLVIEYYDDETVRVLFNDDPLVMPACPTGTCTWSTF
jgi:hypothetical protein